MSTIVLVHGLWVTARSWEKWVPYYESKGHRVLTPAYPGFEVEVEALRADPAPIVNAKVPETVTHLQNIINGLDEKPIIMGHSFGGLLTQLLLDRGLGAAGVAIDSVPPEGVRATPPAQIKSLFPFLSKPATRHEAAGFTPEQWHEIFTNTLSEEDARAAYDRYYVPAPGSWVWEPVLANFTPGKQETWVDFDNTSRVQRRRRRPPHAAVGEQVQRPSLQRRRNDHRLRGVPRPGALDLWPTRLGSGRGQGARLGPCQRALMYAKRRPGAARRHR
jgi:pimeloyl-ACP methyl ester carboxylesterase